MSLRVAGMGWVTPLGSGVSAVWERLLKGERAKAETVSTRLSERTYQAFRVPPDATAGAPPHPRLRRSSAISRFAVVAGLQALEDAGLKLDSAAAERTALIFAISNGGVIYTKRFYHDVVELGAQSASPLLFPETVFNAPASHLAAILGITGASYTLVGDGAVGLLALKMAEDLMSNPALDRCLVVGAEEADWLLCDAYSRWRLLRKTPPIEPFADPPHGTILSEGAGAVLLEAGSDGQVAVGNIDPGCNFEHRSQAAASLDDIMERLGVSNEDLVIASANGTFVDAAEKSALTRRAPAARVFSPKAALGESVGASSLWQVIAAVSALRTGQLPDGGVTAKRAIVSACGLNQQVAALSLVLRS
ncbi:MAG TPA: beta-ketoacyl synthase N-terminal-like domain-containing protein [Chthoniobacterales bacterium]|nr:beta-ketoacyl synthase N-terminal-like domain-containing protein [Chthoniobacterales bacterium]